MNERIKKLAEQAGYNSKADWYREFDKFDLKRFAELVRQDERQKLAQPEQPMSPEHLPKYVATNGVKPMEGGGGGGSQPKREWVGLTDEEVASFENAGVWGEKDIRAIEAALRSKNT